MPIWIISLPLILLATQSAMTNVGDNGPLFSKYFGIATPIATNNIPPKTCQALIAQADQMNVNSVAPGTKAIMKSIDDVHLQIAGENLRSCATNDSLSRTERDLAVGLYGWITVEQNRREHFQN